MKKTTIKSLLLLLVILALNQNIVISAPYGAQWYDVSEYLLGKVYVKVFFVESDEKSPNTENWTEEEKTNCKEALGKALAQVRKRFVQEFEIEPKTGKLPPGVNLDFIIDYEIVEVSVEPIKLSGSGIMFSTGDLKIWINEIMAKKGFNKKNPPPGPQPIRPYPPYQYNVAEYADYLRNTHGTDWAIVIFFIDNSNDEDGKFADGKNAYHPMGIGGPGLLFFNNRGKRFPERQKVPEDPFSSIGIIHEFLHVWYAIDEHPYNKHFREDAVIGYLGGENANFNMAKGIKCSMNSANLYWPELCTYTKKQIGWTDSNGNHIPDILDVKPVVTLFTNNKLGNTYKGKAVSPPLPNRNPYSEGGTIKPPHDLSVVLHLAPVPEKNLGIKDLYKKVPAFNPPFPWTRNDITINTIISVEYRVLQDGRAMTDWIKADPKDGAFDKAVKDFTFTIKPLGPGTYAIEVRAMNSVHLYSDVVRIQVNQ
jgi:hypothetical protein